ncbi:MAG TPA: class I SAM-dependent methyltransferase [Thermoanaerobaculia bacterium]|nr:class I SAM-dependent methyltransferase [Thermoanaerobaculia bacterium]
MKTAVTNRIRWLLDELLPKRFRNARWFMAPLFFVWFKGRHVRTAMDFKRLAPSLSEEEFREVYRRVSTLADRRPTDTHPEAMAYALSKLAGESLLDVGCGRGFFLRKVSGRKKVGCDLLDRVDLGDAAYVTASAERLPFASRSFDTVTCFHTLEHTRDLSAAIAELKRVARKQLIVIVPRQRRYEYTLDLHLQFFETPEALRAAMGDAGEIRQFGDDLVYIAAA